MFLIIIYIYIIKKNILFNDSIYLLQFDLDTNDEPLSKWLPF